MNQVATIEQRQPRSVLVDMSTRYGMEPAAFEATVRATCTPPNTTREEFAAFLLVAKEYSLNPLTKEIYAFPKRGGGIVPIVSIDGWVSLVNSHPACDGFSFEWEHAEDGSPVSCTCVMYRKDRAHPVMVTEYLAECYRPTEPWKMKHRMLRHKTMIQAARYAFGFSGIYDEDEGAKIAEATESRSLTPPPAPSLPSSVSEAAEDAEIVEDDIGGTADETTAFVIEDIDKWIDDLDNQMAGAKDTDTLNEIWVTTAEPAIEADALFPPDRARIDTLYARHRNRITR